VGWTTHHQCDWGPYHKNGPNFLLYGLNSFMTLFACQCRIHSSSSQLTQTQLAHMSCSSVCHQLDSWSVFAYPKQRATVLVGSVLKWRARPQCLRQRRDFVLQMNNTEDTRVFLGIPNRALLSLNVLKSRSRQVTKTRCLLSWKCGRWTPYQ
jgi:hypothetical protein